MRRLWGGDAGGWVFFLLFAAAAGRGVGGAGEFVGVFVGGLEEALGDAAASR